MYRLFLVFVFLPSFVQGMGSEEKNIWIMESTGKLHVIKAVPTLTVQNFLSKVRNSLGLQEQAIIRAFLVDRMLRGTETLEDKGSENNPIMIQVIKTNMVKLRKLSQ